MSAADDDDFPDYEEDDDEDRTCLLNTPSRTSRDRHPPPCGMGRKTAQARLDRIRDTPARNWRERLQKARVIAASYRRRKPEPVWDSPF